MRRLITILAVFSLACLIGGGAYAESAPPVGHDIIDWVNIGDITSETTGYGHNHNLAEWSHEFDADAAWGFDGDSAYYREIWGPSSPASGMPPEVDDLYFYAEIDLDFTKPAHTGQLNIGFFHLGGKDNDNFHVFIGGAYIGEIQENVETSPDLMLRSFLPVPDEYSDGVYTVRLECDDDVAGGFQPGYGRVTMDEIYTFTDPWIDPAIAPVAEDDFPINCSGSKKVNFHYTPGSVPAVKGYSVRVACDASLTFSETDVIFVELPGGVIDVYYDVTMVTEGQVYDVDYAIFDGGVGISAEADLFSVTFHGEGNGAGLVSMTSAELRELDNNSITPVHSGTVGIPVDCDAPLGDFVINDIAADPVAASPGFTNSVDVELVMSVTGAAEMRFSNDNVTWPGPDDGWVPIASTYNPWALIGGDGDKTVYGEFRDAAGNVLTYSEGIKLDTVAPATQVISAPTLKPVYAVDDFLIDSFFDVYYELDAGEDGSDFAGVDLFFQHELEGYDSFGTFTELPTPLQFNPSAKGGDGTYSFYSIGTDFAGNVEGQPSEFGPPPVDYDAKTLVDTAPPDVTSFLVNGTATHTASTTVALSMTVTDVMTMRFSNDGNWPTPEAGWEAYAETKSDWPLISGDGLKTVSAEFMDSNYNISTEEASIILDTTGPDGIVSDITAKRGVAAVDVKWVHNGTDTARYDIYRGLWYYIDIGATAYPEYDDLVSPAPTTPTRPGNLAAAVTSLEWEFAGSVLSTEPRSFSDDWSGGPSRGIYYYEVFAVDALGNGSAKATANDRGLFYLLGDMTGDHKVTGGDINVLSYAYGTSQAGGGTYNNECDVGPTDDNSGEGFPTTDSNINFDDLMIFALNWEYTPVKTQSTEGSLIARFSWVKNDDSTWSLVLAEPCANLKGVNLQAEVSKDAGLSVTASRTVPTS